MQIFAEKLELGMRARVALPVILLECVIQGLCFKNAPLPHPKEKKLPVFWLLKQANFAEKLELGM